MRSGATCMMGKGEVRLRWIVGVLLLAAALLPLHPAARITLGVLGLTVMWSAYRHFCLRYLLPR